MKIAKTKEEFNKEVSKGNDVTMEDTHEEIKQKKKNDSEIEHNRKMNVLANVLSTPGEMLYGNKDRGYKEHR